MFASSLILYVADQHFTCGISMRSFRAIQEAQGIPERVGSGPMVVLGWEIATLIVEVNGVFFIVLLCDSIW